MDVGRRHLVQHELALFGLHDLHIVLFTVPDLLCQDLPSLQAVTFTVCTMKEALLTSFQSLH